MAAELLRQNDFEGSLNQVSAALVWKNTFRLQLSAAKIRMKAHAKRPKILHLQKVEGNKTDDLWIGLSR